MRPLLIVAGVLIVLHAIHLAAAVLAPILLAATLAVAFQPLSERLLRRGWPTWGAAAATSAVCLIVVGVTAAFFIQAGFELLDSLPHYGARLAALRGELIALLDERGLGRAAEAIASADVSNSAQGAVESSVLNLADMLQTLALVLVTTLFIQLEAPALKAALRWRFPDPEGRGQAARALREVQKYLLVKGMLSLANGLLLGLWCWMWGLSNPVLWGVIAFALNFVPVVGSIIAAVPPVALALLGLGIGPALGVLSGYVAVNLVVDNAIEPRVMGRAVGLSPLAVMLAMLVWGFLLGPVGALLSVPLTVAVKLALEQTPELRWLAILLDAEEGTPMSLVRRAPPPQRAVQPQGASAEGAPQRDNAALTPLARRVL
jgi:AI-2 transport protein TqsA